MGLILDTSVLIAGERRGISVLQILDAVKNLQGTQPIELSVITVMELTHGIYRAKSAAQAERRRDFVDEVKAIFAVHDFTSPIATLAGRIEGEQAAVGNSIAFQDLIIGATALSLQFGVLTANTKHFMLVPSLAVVPF